MADGMEIDTSELDAFAKALEQFPDEMESQMVDQAMSAGASVFLEAMVARAPVRVDQPTPKSTSLRQFWVRADLRKRRAKDFLGWIIGPTWATAYVVRWLEYGHQFIRGGKRGKNGNRNVNIGGKVIGHVPAEPFVRPAFDASREKAIAASKAKLAELVAAYWRKAESGWKKSA